MIKDYVLTFVFDKAGERAEAPILELDTAVVKSRTGVNARGGGGMI